MSAVLSSEQINTFRKKGFCIIDTQLDDAVLEGAKRDVAPYIGPDRTSTNRVPHADFNRVQDAWYLSDSVREIAMNPVVTKVLGELYGETARPFQTLNFVKGTQQAVHADSIHFNSEPFGAMCGVWTALEDIGPDQGPLIYYPGSHELPEMNYPDFGLEADFASYPEYLIRLQELIEQHRYQPEYALLKKGQALIWCANILHGGSTQHKRELTRHSQVTHYYLENAKYWRPSESKHGRAYFKPDWVHQPGYFRPTFPRRPSPKVLVLKALSRVKRKLPFFKHRN